MPIPTKTEAQAAQIHCFAEMKSYAERRMREVLPQFSLVEYVEEHECAKDDDEQEALAQHEFLIETESGELRSVAWADRSSIYTDLLEVWTWDDHGNETMLGHFPHDTTIYVD